MTKRSSQELRGFKSLLLASITKALSSKRKIQVGQFNRNEFSCHDDVKWIFLIMKQFLVFCKNIFLTFAEVLVPVVYVFTRNHIFCFTSNHKHISLATTCTSTLTCSTSSGDVTTSFDPISVHVFFFSIRDAQYIVDVLHGCTKI